MRAAVDSDPYLELEDATAPATIAWTAAQNRRSRAMLDELPGRAELARRFEAALAVDTLGVPQAAGDRLFYTSRRAGAEQPVLLVREGAVERIVLDPGALDDGGLVAMDWWFTSPSGRYVAVGLSRGGDERDTLYVFDVESGDRLGEAIPDTRYCRLAWSPDDSGFFYTRYPAGGDYEPRLYRHELGTPFEGDPQIFGAGLAPERTIGVALSRDGRRLVAIVNDGWSRNDVFVADLATSTPAAPRFVPVVVGVAATYAPLPTDAALLLRTDEGAPRGRVLGVEYDRPERDAWRVEVPESDAALAAVEAAGEALVLSYLRGPVSALVIRHADGALEPLAALADRSVLGIDASEDSALVHVLHASYLEPPEIARLTVGARSTEVERLIAVDSPLEAARYRATLVSYPSADGTAIPLTVLARRDLPVDGTAPAIFYGYGGFNVSLVPTFSPTLAPWLDAGGVYAIANLRGGGEFGEAWHRAGMRANKQNVFDDAIAGVEYLGRSGIADPARIAVAGGSNGGLLVAAIATQRPELVRAVACLVPLTDMLRFHRFLIARLWIDEYGDPDVAAEAAVLGAYSPYHRVRDRVAYPAMLIMTAAADGRVDPLHAKKFGARVQAATSSGRDVLVVVEDDAGHGAGKPRSKVAAELVDRYAFLARELGLALPDGVA